MQCNSETPDDVNCSKRPPVAIIDLTHLSLSTTDQSLDQWPSVCQSDVSSTYQHFIQDVDRSIHTALPIFCNQQDWSL